MQRLRLLPELSNMESPTAITMTGQSWWKEKPSTLKQTRKTAPTVTGMSQPQSRKPSFAPMKTPTVIGIMGQVNNQCGRSAPACFAYNTEPTISNTAPAIARPDVNELSFFSGVWLLFSCVSMICVFLFKYTGALCAGLWEIGWCRVVVGEWRVGGGEGGRRD